jgi:hypothetical protein
VTATATATETPTEDPTTAAADPVGGGAYTMPNEVGKDLQAAQDDIQGVVGHFFFSDSVDATGQDRFQVLDRDWQVCSQSVPAGSKFDEDTDVTFKVVRVTESCP